MIKSKVVQVHPCVRDLDKAVLEMKSLVATIRNYDTTLAKSSSMIQPSAKWENKSGGLTYWT